MDTLVGLISIVINNLSFLFRILHYNRLYDAVIESNFLRCLLLRWLNSLNCVINLFNK